MTTGTPSAASRVRNAVTEIAVTAVLAVVIYIIVQTFVVQTYQVEQQSMEPGIEPGQHLLVDKLSPHFDDYSRGDIIVFHPPDGAPDDTPYIKRVIGVAGDHVQIKTGSVFVNGVRLIEPYVDATLNPDGTTGDGSWDVPAGDLWVMGDHRSQSSDSRAFGFVPVSSVIGRAWLRFWPLDTLTILQTPTYPGVPATP